MLRRLALSLGIGSLLLIACVNLVAHFTIKPWLARRILEEIRERVPGEFITDRPEISFFPLSVVLHETQIHLQDLKIEAQIPKITLQAEVLRFSRTHPKFDLHIRLDQPNIQITLSTLALPTSISAPISPLPPWDNRLSLDLDQAAIKVIRPGTRAGTDALQSLTLDHIQMTVQGDRLPGDWRVNANSQVRYQKEGIDLLFPLAFKGYLALSQTSLQLTRCTLELANLSTQASGLMDWVQQTYDWGLRVQIDEIEKLPQQPDLFPTGKWSGGLAGQFHFTQTRDQDWTGTGELHLKKLRGDFVLAKLGWDARGKVQAQSDLQFTWKDQALSVTHFQLQTDLTGLALKNTQYLNKPAGMPLTLSANGSQKDTLKFSQFNLNSSAGNLHIHGQVRNWQRPELGLLLDLQKLDLQALSQLLPVLAIQNTNGKASAKISIKGAYDFQQGIEKSPLVVTILVQAHLYEAHLAGVATTPPQWLNWPLLQQATARMNIQLDRGTYGEIPFEGINWNGTLTHGLLKGQGKVSKIFGGTLILDQVALSATQAIPMTDLALRVQHMDLQPSVSWAMPKWKDPISGIVSASIQAKIPQLSHPDFAMALSGQGSIQVQDLKTGTLNFEAMAKEQLEKVKGIGEPVKLLVGDDLGAKLNVIFSLSGGLFDFKSIQIKANSASHSHDEFHAQGSLNLNQQLELRGSVFLANPPVRGAVLLANADKSGRLKLPFHIHGTLSSPELKIADETVRQIASNTAQFEAKKTEKKLNSVDDHLRQP